MSDFFHDHYALNQKILVLIHDASLNCTRPKIVEGYHNMKKEFFNAFSGEDLPAGELREIKESLEDPDCWEKNELGQPVAFTDDGGDITAAIVVLPAGT